MQGGCDPDFSRLHSGERFAYCVRIGGEAVAQSATQRGLALWMRMVALELGKTKAAGEASTQWRNRHANYATARCTMDSLTQW